MDLAYDVETHFKFGQNWSKYSAGITDDKIERAEDGLIRLFGPDGVRGKSFLDIGSGSGLHSLAALRLGASHVTAIDIDTMSAETTRRVLSRYWQRKNYDVRVANILTDLDGDRGRYDIVYSWGVLHHSGAMWDGVARAGKLVSAGGTLALALYLKTRFCRFWQLEKRFFTRSPAPVQWLMTVGYSAACILRLMLRRENPITHIKGYSEKRGMSWWRDKVDWLGGYPYESATRDEIVSFVTEKGFAVVREMNTTVPFGLLGSSCGEFVFQQSA